MNKFLFTFLASRFGVFFLWKNFESNIMLRPAIATSDSKFKYL